MFAYTLSTSAAVLRKPQNLGTILPRTSRQQWVLAGDAARFVIESDAHRGNAGVDMLLTPFGGTYRVTGQHYAKGASPQG
jgi:hypothetical protein